MEQLSSRGAAEVLIVNGEKAIGGSTEAASLEQVLDSALEKYTPLDLINNVLLDGMKTVGELFGARKMQLPSVLDSAGVMKQAVGILNPRWKSRVARKRAQSFWQQLRAMSTTSARTWSTSSFSNNGLRVVNLGIKQAADTIIAAAQREGGRIGLSGLLVKSTLEMKYVCRTWRRQGLAFPVICGGAAFTRKYVEDDLRREYSSSVFYADDAFEACTSWKTFPGMRKSASIAWRKGER